MLRWVPVSRPRIGRDQRSPVAEGVGETCVQQSGILPINVAASKCTMSNKECPSVKLGTPPPGHWLFLVRRWSFLLFALCAGLPTSSRHRPQVSRIPWVSGGRAPL